MKAARRIAMIVLTAFALAAEAQVTTGEGRPADDLLARVGREVARFMDDFSDVKCTETVAQAKLSAKGKVEYQEESTFDYLVISQNAGGEISLDESRLEQVAAVHRKPFPLMVSNGFATLSLVFHPAYRDSFEFSEPVREVINGKASVRIGFRHIVSRRSPTALLLKGREFPLDLAGTAWIEPESGHITRMVADLENSVEDLGLRALHTEVAYAPVTMSGVERAPWLPTLATIELTSRHQRWRNTHRFSDYKHFSVSTEETVTKKP